jgi:hypothetical protein
MLCIATISHLGKIKIIFFDPTNNNEGKMKAVKMIDIDLNDNNNYINLKNIGQWKIFSQNVSCRIENLPGVGNFIITITPDSYDSHICYTFHLNISFTDNLSDDLSDNYLSGEAIISIKPIPNTYKVDRVLVSERQSYPNKIGWYIDGYKLSPSSSTSDEKDEKDEKDCEFIITKLDSGGNIIGQDSVIYNSTISCEEVALLHQGKDKFSPHTHICYSYYVDINGDIDDCGCKLLFPETRKLAYNMKEGVWRILDDNHLMTEKFGICDILLYKDLKIYSSNINNNGKIVNDVMIREITFTENDEKLERSIILSSHIVGDGEDKNVYYQIESCKDDLILLMSRFDRQRDGKRKLIFVDFYSKNYQIVDENYIDNYSCNAVMNTSFYDFYFTKKISETLDLIFPKELISLIKTF